MEAGWKLLAGLPVSELSRLSDAQIDRTIRSQQLPPDAAEEAAMSELTPTRSVVLELKDERRAMHDGYVFLDEKCLLLAGEILRELGRHEALRRRLLARLCRPPSPRCRRPSRGTGCTACRSTRQHDLEAAELRRTTRSLMGVRLQDALVVGEASPAAPAVDALARSRSLPARLRRAARGRRAACRRRRQPRAPVARIPALGAPRPGAAGRAAARTRPHRRRIETRLEELEQEDAIWMRHGC